MLQLEQIFLCCSFISVFFRPSLHLSPPPPVSLMFFSYSPLLLCSRAVPSHDPCFPPRPIPAHLPSPAAFSGQCQRCSRPLLTQLRLVLNSHRRNAAGRRGLVMADCVLSTRLPGAATADPGRLELWCIWCAVTRWHGPAQPCSLLSALAPSEDGHTFARRTEFSKSTVISSLFLNWEGKWSGELGGFALHRSSDGLWGRQRWRRVTAAPLEDKNNSRQSWKVWKMAGN